MAFFAGVAKNERVFMARLLSFMVGGPAIGRYSYVGTGDGELSGFHLSEAMYGKLIEITCTAVTANEAQFSVGIDGNTGIALAATTNQHYTHEGMGFFITQGNTPFIVGDKWTIVAQGAYSVTNYPALTKPLVVHFMGEPAGVAEDITLTCTVAYDGVTDAQFSVVGSVSGALGTLTMGTLFQSSVVVLDIPRPIHTGVGDNVEIGDTITIPLREGEFKNYAGKYEYLDRRYNSVETFSDEKDTNILDRVAIKGKGNAGTENFYFCLERFSAYAKTVFWALGGYNGWDPAKPMDNQSGYTPVTQQPAVTMHTGEIPFWVNVSGRRVVGVIKNGTFYEHFYMGLMQPHQAPTTYPNPLFIGGSCDYYFANYWKNDPSGSWAKELRPHTAYFNPVLQYDSTPDLTSAIFHNPDGGIVRPYMSGSGVDDSDLQFTTDAVYGVSTALVMPYNVRGLERMEVNFDGTYTPVPIWVTGAYRSGKSVVGRLDGIFGVAGVNQNAENVLRTANGYYIVFNNVYKTGRNDFCALEVL